MDFGRNNARTKSARDSVNSVALHVVSAKTHARHTSSQGFAECLGPCNFNRPPQPHDHSIRLLGKNVCC